MILTPTRSDPRISMSEIIRKTKSPAWLGMRPYVYTGGEGGSLPEPNLFDPPFERCWKKKEREKFGGKAAKFLTFSAALPPKIGGFILLWHFSPPKWRNLSPFGVLFLILLSPSSGDFDRAHVWMRRFVKKCESWIADYLWILAYKRIAIHDSRIVNRKNLPYHLTFSGWKGGITSIVASHK